ncbi:MAG TPA: hypothetical protein VOA80_13600 [Thermoanaerobaculia bacterium]|nr:hypothetical protein [Thermoanaerobaculia bacterium]
MKRSILLFAALAIGTTAVATADGGFCGSQTTVTLFGGQTIDTGTVTIANDASNLTITYTTNDPWLITAVHLAVADSLAGIPQNKNDNPIPGHFPINSTFNPPVTTITYTIPLGNFTPGETIYIGAQAEVQAPSGQGGSQTAWGFGPRFGGHNWATYITYQVQDCISPV